MRQGRGARPSGRRRGQVDEALLLDEPGLDPGPAPAQVRDLLRGEDHERGREALRERAARRPRRLRPRGRPTATHAARFAHGPARARIEDVVSLPRPRRAQGLLARRDPGEDPPLRGSGALRVRGHPSRSGGGSRARTELKPPWTRRVSDLPLLQQLRHAVDRVALADAAEVEPDSPRLRARTAKSSGTRSRPPSPEPIEMSNAPPVRSYMRRAISRHSMVDGLTRVPCPADRWLMRETSLLATNRLCSCSSRSTSSEGRLGRLARVAAVGVNAADLERRGHRRVREAVDAVSGCPVIRACPRLAHLRLGLEPAVVLPQTARRVAPHLDLGTQLDRPLEEAHVQFPLSRRRQIVELPHEGRLHVRSQRGSPGRSGPSRGHRSTTPLQASRAGRRAGARGSRG